MVGHICGKAFHLMSKLLDFILAVLGPCYTVLGTRDNPSPEATLSRVYI